MGGALPGRGARLLFDKPAVLGRSVMDEIDAARGARTLREGLEAAMHEGGMPPAPIGALTALLSAAFDQADLGVEAAAVREELEAAFDALVGGPFARNAAAPVLSSPPVDSHARPPFRASTSAASPKR